MKKFLTFATILVILSSTSYSMVSNTMSKGTVKEIVGLKCPNHDYVNDNHHFMYESIGGNPSTNGTRCLRCGYTKSLHKPQK